MTANLENLWECIFSLVYPVDFVFLLDLPALFLLFPGKMSRWIANTRKAALFAAVFLLSASFILYVPFKFYVLKQPDERIERFINCWVPVQTAANLSPIGYHLFDVYTYWKDCRPIVLNAEEKEEIRKWFDAKHENLPDNRYKDLLEGNNLIFIQVESLESFVINKKIAGREITPNLNALLKHSLYFSNFYEQVYNGTTSDAELMANTSVYPVRKGSTFFRFPNNTYNSLPRLLQKKGYATLAVHPDRGAYWNWMEALSSFGFEKCLDSTAFEIDEVIGLGLSDGSLFRQVNDMLRSQRQPFYLFMITLTSHAPFSLPPHHRTLQLDAKIDRTILGNYLQCIHYTDQQIGEFLKRLEKDGLLEKTTVVIYGDHCGVNKFYRPELAKIQAKDRWWQDNNNRVPLIIYDKRLNRKEITTASGQIDIMPTICYLMGVEESRFAGTAMGRNLLKTQKNFAVLADMKVVGKPLSEQEKQDAVKGLAIADKIIRSNYFASSDL
jgi:phosphoglycerol transferase MdoB-like AlkP superfamily enzyme